MDTTTLDHEDARDTQPLNSLLQGEQSVVDIYAQAIERFDDVTVIAELQRIRDEHSRAVRELRDRIVWLGSNPPDNASGPGNINSSITATQPATVIAALIKVEEDLISEYEVLLDNDAIHHTCKSLIQSDLVPNGHQHVEALNRLVGGLDR